MSSRHQPLNGADSAESLADSIWNDIFLVPSSQCAACSLPAALGDIYCAGHARLFEYTDHERSGGIAANE